jgi:hypothetical protein
MAPKPARSLNDGTESSSALCGRGGRLIAAVRESVDSRGRVVLSASGEGARGSLFVAEAAMLGRRKEQPEVGVQSKGVPR